MGLLVAVLEGTGLLLFIPILRSMGAGDGRGTGLEAFFDRAMAALPSGHATAALVGLLCLTILAKNAVLLVNTAVSRHVDGQVAHRLRTRIFEQTLRSCVDYRAGHRRSDIVTTIAENSWKVSTALGLCYRLLISASTFAVFMALMMVISLRLTLIAAVFLTLSALVIRWATQQASETGRAVVEENKAFGLRMWESINALQLIRAFGREDYEAGRFARVSEQVRRRLLKLDVLWAVPGPISEVLITLLIGALIVAAQRSGIGIASIAAFLSLLYRLQGPTRELMQAKVTVEGLDGAIEDVAGFLDATAAPFLADGSVPATPIREGLQLRDVSFRYGDNEAWALRNVSIHIPAGKTTAIVGQSGAGKSTLMALLFRFQDPTEGVVSADGVALTRFQLSGWRRQIALMSQEVQLFNDTVQANIGYGDLDADFEDIRNAARVAGAETFIEALPLGYQTVLGDHGMRLSGGQRQRIALARTVVRNPQILMLDEATNALDAESERAFQLALEQYAHRRTVVVIAHRLATVQRADQVVVLEGGRVVEAGPPAQLIDRGGRFARLHHLQHGTEPEPEARSHDL